MGERFVSRGFRGRRDAGPAGRVPPGQYVTHDFPVLSAGPTPRVPLAQWTFEVRGAVGSTRRWSWAEFQELPRTEVTVDIHCVTKWSKLGTSFGGVSLDTLMEGVEPQGAYAMAFSYGGYTTNLALADFVAPKETGVPDYLGAFAVTAGPAEKPPKPRDRDGLGLRIERVEALARPFLRKCPLGT